MKKEHFGILIIAIAVIAFFIVMIFQSDDDQSTIEDSLVSVDDIVYGGVPEGDIPAINNPQFISVLDADYFMDDNEYGVLVTINDQSRYYPYSILTWHQVVNDAFAGIPIVVSYSPLCYSGAVFERTLGDQEVTFSVSENVYNNNLLLLDDKTNSQWSQLMGQAIFGGLSGENLTTYPYQILRWNIVRDNYPNAEVLSRETGFSRNYDRDPYTNFYHEKDILFPLTNTDDRIYTKEIVYGIVIDNIPAAFTVLDIMTSNNQTTTEVINEEQVTASYNDDTATHDFVDGSGAHVQSQETFWFCWVAHYPQTELFSHEEDAATDEIEPTLINPSPEN